MLPGLPLCGLLFGTRETRPKKRALGILGFNMSDGVVLCCDAEAEIFPTMKVRVCFFLGVQSAGRRKQESLGALLPGQEISIFDCRSWLLAFSSKATVGPKATNPANNDE